MYRALFYRTVLSGGAVIIVALFLQLLVSVYLQLRYDAIDRQLLSLGPEYAEVTILAKQVQEIERQVSDGGSLNNPSHVAKILYDIARNTPTDVWLYKLTHNEEEKERTKVTLHGYTRNQEKITEFVKNLSASFSNVRLVRSGATLHSETLIPAAGRVPSMITFSILAEIGP